MRYFYFLAAVALTACQTQDLGGPLPSPAAGHHAAAVVPSSLPLPKEELAGVRRATARYRDLAVALADGYQDINVVLPNMGRHFMRPAILDATFEAERPEILVYSPGESGRPELVAVEYAVPLSLSTTAPEGFSGSADVWFASQQFQLWTLHAWVWKGNPDGVFNATNRRVP